ncbi:MAG: hypothetical protein ABEJ73_07995 [Haloplanus sp.]
MRSSFHVIGAVLLLIVVAATSPVHAVPVSDASDDASMATTENGVFARGDSGYAAEGEELAGEGEEREEDGETGAGVLGEWWGLGGEASEAPYVGLAELGVVLLVIGVGGYSAGKRTSVVPTKYRRRLLQAHEWTVLTGTALTLPHFVAVEEWGGLGLLVALLLAVEVASGLYGRHLHRHVIRLGRGGETPSLVGRTVAMTKRTLFSRWRRVHVVLTVATGIVLVLHIVTAVGE